MPCQFGDGDSASLGSDPIRVRTRPQVDAARIHLAQEENCESAKSGPQWPRSRRALSYSRACAAPQSEIVEGSSITVAWNQAFYSYNDDTSFGNATGERQHHLHEPQLGLQTTTTTSPRFVRDESFGSYEVVSEDPLTSSTRSPTTPSGLTVSPSTPPTCFWHGVANTGRLNTPRLRSGRVHRPPDTGRVHRRLPDRTNRVTSMARSARGLGPDRLPPSSTARR